ncbi:MAG: hypothetical protein WCP89_00920 [archaeon]
MGNEDRMTKEEGLAIIAETQEMFGRAAILANTLNYYDHLLGDLAPNTPLRRSIEAQRANFYNKYLEVQKQIEDTAEYLVILNGDNDKAA